MGRGSKIKKRSSRILWIVLLLASIFYYFCLPDPLFDKPYATLVLDRDGEMLGGRIAKDEQWRFAEVDSVPLKFEQSILTFEDEYFYNHPGFNPVSLLKALWRNVKAGKVVSGGSTISMQVIRMSRNNPSRTILEKVYEIVLATRLEWRYSKKEILNLYASHAPFGGNAVGIEAASWRYFGRSPFDLSWSETATLAILPNAPGLIHPGKNREALELKRNRLLKKMWKVEVFDEQTYKLALLEELPDKPIPLTNIAPHLSDRLSKMDKGKRHITTIDSQLQRMCRESLGNFREGFKANEVHNGAILLLDSRTGEVQAYVGNQAYSETVGIHNDMIQTPRSSGSILKPFLYSSMLNSGSLWPKELVKDIPVILADFKPENFIPNYAGALPANEALANSLNIPFVFMLKEYGVERFRKDLIDFGFTTINRSADNYGLSLILGGAEVTAWDLGKAYYSFSRALNGYNKEREEAKPSNIYFLEKEAQYKEGVAQNKGAVYHTLQALTNVTRPSSEFGWQFFDQGTVAWKTGTSFGHRDAWAVGVTPTHIAVVWIGNATGEGRPGLVGAKAAGPVLFDVLNKLGKQGDFDIPHDEMREKLVCAISGLPKGSNCLEVDTVNLPNVPFVKEQCSYHQTVFVDTQTGERLNQQCAKGKEMLERNYFVLPSAMAWYYAHNNKSYEPLPSWSEECGVKTEKVMELIYPEKGTSIFLPKDLDGAKQKVIIEVAHQRPGAKLFWHLNKKYIGITQDFHQFPLELEEGEYRLHVEDEEGNSIKGSFRIVER